MSDEARRGSGEGVPGGRLLARNTVLNLVGQAAPMVVALATIPLLIAGLGTDRFAILTLAWMTIGYFSLFDLGLSRGLTQMVADRLGVGNREGMPALIWTALVLMTVLGAAGGALLAAVSPWVVRDALNIPTSLQVESRHSFYLLAFALPWVIAMNGLRGVLEAYQRFDLINRVRIPLGSLTYLCPLLVLPFSQNLVPVIQTLVALRIAALLAHLYLCVREVPEMRGGVVIRPALMVPLVRMGSWMTVSNLISPLMVYADRFVIGAMLPVAAVAYYVTPYELVTRLWLIPTSLTGVFFPALAASFVHDRRQTAEIFLNGSRFVFLLLLPVTLVLTTFAREGLGLWLGDIFAAEGTAVLRWLAVGVFVNSVAQVAFVTIQGTGRPDITAKLHLLQVPFYMVGLWWLVSRYGVTGAAMAWTARVCVDALLLFVMTGRLLSAQALVARQLIPMLAAGVAVLIASMLIDTPLAKGLLFAASLVAVAAGGWLRVLRRSEREWLLALVGRRPMPGSP